MIEATVGARPSVLLLGAVRGLLADAATIPPSLDRFAPEAVGVSVSEEELRSLEQYFGAVDGEPVVPLSVTELSELRGLVRYGEVSVPNPSVLEAIRWGRARGVAVRALDPSDDGAAMLFTEHIGYVELVRRTVRENRFGRTPPKSATADDYAIAWADGVGGGRGSRRYAGARNAHLAEAARALGEGRGRVAVVVDRERFTDVRRELEPAGRSA